MRVTPGAAGEELDGSGEVESLGLLHPAVDITALAAAEAVVQATGAVDRQGLGVFSEWNGHTAIVDRPERFEPW